MLSLKNSTGAVKLCDCFIDGKKSSVYFHQKKDLALRNEIEDVAPILEQPSFREKYDLSRKDITELIPALNHEDIPEDDAKLRKKYFQVKRALDRISLTEMSFEDQKDRFEVNFPEKKKNWAAGWEIVGNSGSGKTVFTVNMIANNWSLPKGQRRHVLYLSPEESHDASLKH